MIDNLQKNFIWKKLHIDMMLLFFIILILVYSIFLVWSASSQDITITKRQIIHIVIGLLIMIIMAQVPPRIYEVMAPYLYAFCVFLLFLVEFFGQINRGAQRWLDFGIIRFQPSEIAKIAVPLMVARFINRDRFPPSFKNTAIVLVLIFIPTLLVALQPDLGTAILVATSGLFILFLSGVNWKLIIVTVLLITIFIPVLWFSLLHDYQRDRIIMLIYPKTDPLGAGYHIIQSKIAIGSGGIFGKGFLQGTQSQLEFLPERHTDFIFAVLGEELGFIGVLVLLLLYFGVIFRGLVIAMQAKNVFARIITGDLILVFFVYIFANIGMVSGIIPVVGVPLPLVSYGGSALVVLMAGFGIVMSIHTHRKMLSKIL